MKHQSSIQKNIKKICLYMIFPLWGLGGISCTKYLDEKPDNKLVVPTTLADLQAILDNYSRVNQFAPGVGEASADNYYIGQNEYNSITSEPDRRIYTWEKDNVVKGFPNDWSYAWDNIYRTNTILATLPAVEKTATNASTYNNIQGQALSLRAKCMMSLAFAFCLAYDNNATTNLGLPIRTNPDFNTPSVRLTLKDTYNSIEADLLAASALLPDAPLHVLRLAKPANYGLLARFYLSKRDYQKAGLYADSSLRMSKTLLDYNTLSATAMFPFSRFNNEVVWESYYLLHTSLVSSYARVDTVLYNSYNNNDLRKTLFYKANTNGTYFFRGSYSGGYDQFDGIAVDEIYLIRAEAFARNGNKEAALADLNTLLAKRFKTGTFTPITAIDANDALAKILVERRKELAFRELRWMDIKRYNAEGAGITLTRNINNQVYTLPPNDPRYAIAIPEDVIATSGMQQNPR
jgi:hypothetical protein